MSDEVNVQELGKLEVLDPQSDPTELASLWREQPAVLVFVRHFG
jgi:hypothetical protein